MRGEVTSMDPARMLWVILPAYNEEEAVGKVIEEWVPVLRAACADDYVIAAINDGSTDSTLDVLKSYAKKFPEIRVFDKKNSGHGQSCMYGYRIAVQSGAVWILQIDSDGQCDPRYFHEFWGIKDGKGAVFGFRRTRADGRKRWIVSRLVSVVTWLATQVWVPDANVPYRLMRVESLSQCLCAVPESFHLANIWVSVLLERSFGIHWMRIHFRKRTHGAKSAGALSFLRRGVELFGQLRGAMRAEGQDGASHLLAPIAWVALLVVPSIHFSSHWRAWRGDQTNYAYESVRLWGDLLRDPVRWVDSLFHLAGLKPPGLIWSGQFFVPLGQLYGQVEIGLLACNLLWQLVALMFVYFASLNAFGTSAALVSSLFAASTPIFVWMTNHYFQEPMQAASVASVFWAATVASRLSRRKGAIILGLCAIFLMLSKQSSPLYVLAPGLLILLRRDFFRVPTSEGKSWSRLEVAGALTAGALGFACLCWYVIHFRDVIDYVNLCRSPGPEVFGSSNPFSHKLRMWLGTLEGTFAGKTAWGLLALLGVAIVVKTGRKGKEWLAGDALFLACLVQVAIFLVAFSAQYNEEFRYDYPVLIPLALMAGWASTQIAHPGFKLLWMAVLALQLNSSVWQNVFRPVIQGSTWTPQAPGFVTSYVDQAQNGLEVVAENVCRRSTPTTSVFLMKHRALNPIVLGLFLEKRKLSDHCKVLSLSPAESVDQAVERIEKSKPLVFVGIRPDLFSAEPGGAILVSLLERARQLGSRVPMPQVPQLEVYAIPGEQ